VNVRSATEVEEAIRSLTNVWGGVFLPILDIDAPLSELRLTARMLDLDSLFAESPAGDLEDLLRIPGYMWRGRGDWGPFADDEAGFRKGLLDVTAIANTSIERRARRVPREKTLAWLAFAGWGADLEHESRPIELTRAGLVSRLSYVDPIPQGLFVIRPESAADVAWFWTCRSLGGECYPLEVGQSVLNDVVFGELDSKGIPSGPTPAPNVPGPPRLDVWGWDDLTLDQKSQIDTWVVGQGGTVRGLGREHAMAGAWFPGFEKVASRSFRKEADPDSLRISVELPAFPFKDLGFLPGIVAAEIDFHEASGLDPRLTAAVPPHRRHAKLIEGALGSAVDHVRVSAVGPVLGVQAGADEVTVPLASNLDVMRLLFDDPPVRTSQSDDGKFQSRVAEMFGGGMSGALTQPGIRAAIERVADKGAGVTLSELTNVFAKARGDWPDRIYRSRLSQADYDRAETRRLLNSGLLIPMLDLQCTSCRVVSKVHPNDLNTSVRCEFCNEDFNLAIALALAKPTWRYRLAAHLPSEKIRAMLPAVAALSVLSAMHVVEGPPMSHVLGLEVTIPNRNPVEVDVAAILHEDDWTVVLGEVKSHHPIDQNDVENLAHLQDLLLEKETLSVVMFATLKLEFNEDERNLFRTLIEQTTRSVERNGSRLPIMPLLFTQHELSVPWGDEAHPWRWRKAGQGGIFGTAIESCRKNLGLIDFKMSKGGTEYVWSE